MEVENREGSDCLQRPSNTCRFSLTGAKSESNANLLQGVTETSERVENGQWTADTHSMDMERSVTAGQSDTWTNLQQQVHDVPTSPSSERAGNYHLHEGVGGENHHELEPETTIATQPKDRQMKKGALLCLSATKIMALMILGIVIAGLFSVPVAFFVLETNHFSDATEAECNTYTGEVCQSVLLARQSCILGRENSSAVSVSLTSSLHTTLEQQFAQLLMSVTPSPVCETELLSFLCVEAFAGLCDGNGVVHRTTRQECERITTTVCAEEFQILLPILEANGFALSCDTFPNSSSICANMANDREDGHAQEVPIPFNQDSSGTGVALDRNCSEGFFMDETSDLRLCTPECGEWRPLSNDQVKVLTIVSLTSGAFGATLCLVIVVLSFIHYRTMFSFPGIFIFYQMLSSMVYAIVYLINYVDFKALLCGSRNLLESLMPGNETPLCIISASAWIYISHQVALWWIFHLSMVFFAIFWPFKYHYLKQLGYFKYIHFVMVLAALILPIIPVIICYNVDGYVLYFLIVPTCVARNIQAAFYSHVLPLLAAVAIGLYLLILIFWKFFSEEWICSKKQGFTKRQVEIKIILLLCCYVIIWADVFSVTVATMIEAEDYTNTLTEYFTCEAAGVEGCPSGAFEKFDVVSKIIAYALIGLYPAIFLVYFVSVKKTCGKSRTAINSTASVLSRSIG